MLTNLKFANKDPRLMESTNPLYPKAFSVMLNLGHEFWQGKDTKPCRMATIETIEPGIYHSGGNFDHNIAQFTDYQEIRECSYGVFDENWNLITHEDFNKGAFKKAKKIQTPYGVADNVEQIKKFFKTAIKSKDKLFVISYFELNKKEETKGGWRWHKWGEYIGVQKPQCEYLVDEPIIEKVLVFHGHFIEKKKVV